MVSFFQIQSFPFPFLWGGFVFAPLNHVKLYVFSGVVWFAEVICDFMSLIKTDFRLLQECIFLFLYYQITGYSGKRSHKKWLIRNYIQVARACRLISVPRGCTYFKRVLNICKAWAWFIKPFTCWYFYLNAIGYICYVSIRY